MNCVPRNTLTGLSTFQQPAWLTRGEKQWKSVILSQLLSVCKCRMQRVTGCNCPATGCITCSLRPDFKHPTSQLLFMWTMTERRFKHLHGHVTAATSRTRMAARRSLMKRPWKTGVWSSYKPDTVEVEDSPRGRIQHLRHILQDVCSNWYCRQGCDFWRVSGSPKVKNKQTNKQTAMEVKNVVWGWGRCCGGG